MQVDKYRIILIIMMYIYLIASKVILLFRMIAYNVRELRKQIDLDYIVCMPCSGLKMYPEE